MHLMEVAVLPVSWGGVPLVNGVIRLLFLCSQINLLIRFLGNLYTTQDVQKSSFFLLI